MGPVIELVVKGGSEATIAAVACAKCRIVAPSRVFAERCCLPNICVCGKECERHWTVCESCRQAKENADHVARVIKAKRVPESEVDHLLCDHCDNFFENSNELFEQHYDDGCDLPTYAWACYSRGLTFDAHELVSDAVETQEHHEDAMEQVGQAPLLELQRFLDEWVNRCGVSSYFPENEVVDLTEARAAFLKQRAETVNG